MRIDDLIKSGTFSCKHFASVGAVEFYKIVYVVALNDIRSIDTTSADSMAILDRELCPGRVGDMPGNCIPD